MIAQGDLNEILMGKRVTGMKQREPSSLGRATWWRVLTPTGWIRAVATAHTVPVGAARLAACPRCGHRLLTARGPGVTAAGRCVGCADRLGPGRWTVEIGVVGAVAVVLLGPRTATELPANLWFAVLGIALAAVDVTVRRLPNQLTLLWAGGLLACLALPAVLDDRGGDWVRALAGGVALALLFAVMASVRPGSLGWGDVKAAMAIGAALGWHGWVALYAGMFVAFSLAAGYAIVLLARGARRGSKMPLGPFLVVGALLVAAVWPAAV